MKMDGKLCPNYIAGSTRTSLAVECQNRIFIDIICLDTLINISIILSVLNS